MRKALVEALRPLNPGVVRWPGGCFADSYDWRDGIGPRNQRPRRTNFWINDPQLEKLPPDPQQFDPNEFGTNEFMRFVKLVGASPYLAANLRSATPKDFYQWVEYCNAPAAETTLSAARAANGDPSPFAVRYWGIGNESWGCGGEFTAEEYAVEYRRWVTWVPRYGVDLSFIAAGPNGDDLNWSRGFFNKLTEKGKGALNSLHGFAMHYYCGTAGKGQAIDFTTEDWYELLAKADRMESLIDGHWAVMGEVDTAHKVKLVVDEWGAWHNAGTEVDPAFLFGQTPTLRDALITALTLDIFHRHADKVVMANVAQLVNNLHCLFLARGDRFLLTPNYHVFEMYAAHQGGQSLRTLFSAPRASKALWGLAGSASLQGRELVLSVVNPSATEPRDAEIVVRGATAAAWRARTLSGRDIHAHNSFDHPNDLVPVESTGHPAPGGFVYRFAPASVTRLRLQLA